MKYDLTCYPDTGIDAVLKGVIDVIVGPECYRNVVVVRRKLD